jgi:hypothetical protein
MLEFGEDMGGVELGGAWGSLRGNGGRCDGDVTERYRKRRKGSKCDL